MAHVARRRYLLHYIIITIRESESRGSLSDDLVTIVYYYLLLSLLLYAAIRRRRTRNNVWETLYFSNDIFASETLCALTFRICVNDLYSLQNHVRAVTSAIIFQTMDEGWSGGLACVKNVCTPCTHNNNY